jgi:hypothetical protein
VAGITVRNYTRPSSALEMKECAAFSRDRPQLAGEVLALLAAFIYRLQTLFQGFHFAVQSLGQMRAESGEVIFDGRHFG